MIEKDVEGYTKEDYLELVNEVLRHGRLYYTEDQPEISDSEYDRLYRLLENIEETNPDWKV